MSDWVLTPQKSDWVASPVQAPSNPSMPSLNLKEQELKRFEQATGIKRSPGDIIRNLLAGMATGAQNVGEVAAPLRKYVPQNLKVFPSVDPQEQFGINPENKSELIQGVGQYAPLMAAGPLGLLGDLAAGGAYGATQAPESPLMGASITGGTNAGVGLLNTLTKSTSPIVRALARSTAGAGIGYATGGKEGAEVGAAGGFLAPAILNKMGLGLRNPAEALTAKITPEESAATLDTAQAGLRLGTPLSPGEASGRPDITSQEAVFGRTGESAAERTRVGQERVQQQQQAIKRLKSEISPSSRDAAYSIRQAANDYLEEIKGIRQNQSDALYRQAHGDFINPRVLATLESRDPNITEAINAVINNPLYQKEGELLGLPRHSVKVLDYAKINYLDPLIAENKGTVRTRGNPDTVRILTDTKNRLLRTIDNFSPVYRQARATFENLSPHVTATEQSVLGRLADLSDDQLKTASQIIFDPSQTNLRILGRLKQNIMRRNPEAWDSIVRNEIERLNKKGSINGVNFYRQVLANDNQFKQFELALDHNPQALETLRDMKKSWKNLINVETPRTAHGQSKTAMNTRRETLGNLLDMVSEVVAGKQHKEALNYLYSPRWIADYQNLASTRNAQSRTNQLSTMFAKLLPPTFLLNSNRGQEQ